MDDSVSAGAMGIHWGEWGEYRWLTSEEQLMGDFVRHCPFALLGRYVAVTQIDSGAPWLTERQKERGWELQSGVLYSTKLGSCDDLIYQRDGQDTPGLDEWYLFDEAPPELGAIDEGNPFLPESAPRPGRLFPFVGYGGFGFHCTDGGMPSLLGLFWQQIEWVRPVAYVCDGVDFLNFACRDSAVFEQVRRALREARGAAML